MNTQDTPIQTQILAVIEVTRWATVEQCVRRIAQYTDLTDTQKVNIAADLRALLNNVPPPPAK